MNIQKTIRLLLISLIFFTVSSTAQQLLIDMDTASGVQETIAVDEEGGILTLAIRIEGAENLFSYQFKVVFDTGSFSFIDAQQDFGLNGEQNILTTNGGSIISINQLQTNPPVEGTVDFSGSITGSDSSRSAAGDGLAGVLYLESKLQPGDTAVIEVVEGFYVSSGSDLIPCPVHVPGMAIRTEELHIDFSDRTIAYRGILTSGEIALVFPSSVVHVALPAGLSNDITTMTVSLFYLDGKIRNSWRFDPGTALRRIQVPGSTKRRHGTAGILLCTVSTGSARCSRMVRIP